MPQIPMLIKMCLAMVKCYAKVRKKEWDLQHLYTLFSAAAANASWTIPFLDILLCFSLRNFTFRKKNYSVWGARKKNIQVCVSIIVSLPPRSWGAICLFLGISISFLLTLKPYCCTIFLSFAVFFLMPCIKSIIDFIFLHRWTAIEI